MNTVVSKQKAIELLTAARYVKGYERLEPDVLKDASPVLRRGRASNRSFLFGNSASMPVASTTLPVGGQNILKR